VPCSATASIIAWSSSSTKEENEIIGGGLRVGVRGSPFDPKHNNKTETQCDRQHDEGPVLYLAKASIIARSSSSTNDDNETIGDGLRVGVRGSLLTLNTQDKTTKHYRQQDGGPVPCSDTATRMTLLYTRGK